MVEKPKPEDAPSNLAIIGRDILTPDIFDIIRATPPGANGEMPITDSFNIQAQKRMVLGYKFKGRRFDCGSLDGFVAVTNYVYDRMKSTK
jgi:UTP--glucose-1-phosphate uridylyltransferase